jgi:hypothetical protein
VRAAPQRGFLSALIADLRTRHAGEDLHVVELILNIQSAHEHEKGNATANLIRRIESTSA